MLLGGGCSSTGSDILYIKKMYVNGVGHSRDEKISVLHNIGSSLGRNLCS